MRSNVRFLDAGVGTMICTGCDQPCKAKIIDAGIGEYEFWGQKGTDVNKQTVSACCEEAIETEDGEYESCGICRREPCCCDEIYERYREKELLLDY
jgi:hypothetical protein